MTQAQAQTAAPGSETPAADASAPALSNDRLDLLREALQSERETYDPTLTQSGPPQSPGEEPGDDDELLPPEPEDDPVITEVTGEAAPAEGHQPQQEAPGEYEEDSVVAQWADTLIEQPQRWNQIPAPKRTDVLRAMVPRIQELVATELVEQARGAMEQVRQVSYQAGFNAGKAAVASSVEDAELADLEQNDPTEFARIGREDRQRMLRYYQRQEQAAAAPALVATFESAREIVAGIKEDPYAVAYLERRAAEFAQANPQHPGLYNARNPAGLANLKRDVVEAQVQSRLARERSAAPPAVPPAAAQRQQAAQARRQVPVTTPRGGAPAAQADGILSNDRFDLARQMVEQERKTASSR